MILLDYSQVAIGNLHQQLKLSGSNFDPLMFRHMVLNSIRKANKDFGAQYGQLVICADGSEYWRKERFLHYKANRKRDREDSGIDWDQVFAVLNDLRKELKENFPYKVMHVPHCEADDIIGVLTRTFKHAQPILILSSDKDFVQLLDRNVSIYRPQANELVSFVEAE